MSKKIFFIHLRNRSESAVSNCGGATIAYRETDDGKIEFATARCMPNENFSRKEGRVRSGGRINSPRLRKVTGPMTEQEFRSKIYSVIENEFEDYGTNDASYTLAVAQTAVTPEDIAD